MRLSRWPAAAILLSCITTAVSAATLQSPRLRAEIDDATGAVASLAEREGGPLLARSLDRYALQPDPKTEIVATEAEDRVVERRGSAFRCENPKLPGVRIEKAYAIEGGWLTKRVTFTAERADVGLLKYSTASVAAPEFYQGAYLNNPTRHPSDYPYLFTRDLEAEQRIVDSHSVADHYLVICTNPDQGRGLAQYRLKVNGRFVHPLASYAYEPTLTYGPEGWRMGAAAAWMSKDRPALSCEVRWHAFRGDHVAFHREFLALPEFRKEWDGRVPAWLGKVQMIANWGWTESSRRLDRYRRMVESLPNDALLMVTIGGVFCNTRAYLADPIPAPSGIPLPAAELRKVVDELHAISPRIKVGPITWQWGFGELDPVFKEHPEWTVHDGEGKPVFACTGWSDEKVHSQLLTPECRGFVLGQFRGMVKRYDFDFIYMDTGQGGVTRFDWATRRNAQDYEWADLYTGIRDAARSNRDGIAFFNGTPRLYSVGADCGYFEGVGLVNERDWRALADRLFLVKLYQPGERWTMPLYWNSPRDQEYANYCFLLALRPGSFLASSASGRWPLVAAANELAEARLAPEANPTPCWWREQTETECYALKMPRAGIVAALHHGKEPAKVTLSCDLAPLGLDPAKPVRMWLATPRAVEDVEKSARLTESDVNALFAREGKAAHRCVESLYLGTREPGGPRLSQDVELLPGRTALLILTQAPSLACAVDGRPTHFLLPPPPGRKAEVVASDRALPAEVIARREGFSVEGRAPSMALVPERSSPATVNRKGQDVSREIAGVQVRRFLSFDCEHNEEDNASFDVDGLRLRADMGGDKVMGFASAGLEADNLGAVRLRVKLGEPTYRKYAERVPSCYVGLAADYHTGKGYTQRVLFPLGPAGPASQTSSRPWWGVYEDSQGPGKQPIALVAPLEAKGELTLDLGRYAPEGWDGRAILGALLESCGLGATIEAAIVGNGPAGPRDPAAFQARPAPAAGGQAGTFRGAALVRLEDGAELKEDRIVLSANAALEAAGFRVVTWKVRLEEKAAGAALWINFRHPDGKYELVKLPFSEGPLAGKVKPGGESRFDIDLGQFAPPDWTGQIRVRLMGTGVSAEIVDNQSFQVF